MIRTYAGVALATLATLLLELLLTRIFSVTLYYHFAFMVISLALFGLGLSGVVLYLRPERFPQERLAELLASSCRRFAITTVLALIFVVNHSLTAYLDALTVGRFTSQHFFQLAFLFGIASLPFFYGGLVVSLAMFHLRERVTTIYFFDLAGASLACLLLDTLLGALGGPNAVLLVAVLAAAASLLFGSDLTRWRPQRASVWLTAALALLLALNLGTGVVRVGSFKFVKQELLEFSKWNALSRIEVQEVKGVEPSLTIDAMARTNIYSWNKRARFAKHQQQVPGLAYVLGPNRKVLIIGPGGGVDVLTAMVNGHRDITLAEINPIILNDVMRERYKAYNGDLYGRPGVKAHLAEGRSFVRRSAQRFDVIQATLVDTWAAAATGTFSLSENHLYTVEAFEDYLTRLTNRGVVTMSRWLHVPGMEFVRLCSLARAALVRLKVKDPHLHLFAAGERGVGVLLVKRTPFTKVELDKLHRVSAQRKYLVLYSPRGTHPRSPASIVLGPKDPAQFYAKFPVDVRPVYDDRPFFFYAVKRERLLKALFTGELLGLNSFSAVVLVAVLGLVTLLVLAGIVLPLWLGKRGTLAGATGSKLRDLAFFLGIGVGFIVVEIALLARFTLYLGHPIHSLRVVLFALLAASAVGSLLSGKVRAERLVLLLAGAGLGVTALLALYSVALGPLFHSTMGWSLTARVLVSGALVALPGMLMGMMLPTGVRLLSSRHAEIIPWAWGLNGAASVLGSVIAMIVAIHGGFQVTLMAGGALYVVAVLAGLRRRKS